MLIAIIKTNDKRYDYLALMLDNILYTNDIRQLFMIDTLILPFKGIDNDGLIKNTNLYFKDIVNQNPNLKKVICASIPSLAINYPLIEFESILDDENFKMKNARLTAECAIKRIENDLEESLANKRILVLGYGNISYYLIKILDSLNANVKVYSVDKVEIKLLKFNNKYININNPDILNYDLIINTIPKKIIEGTVVRKIEFPIYEIASYPYGFDYMAFIDKKNIQLLEALPSKEMPKSAALLIYEWLKKRSLI